MTEFTLAESLKAQKAMRDELGLGEEHFAIPQFIGMVSDEIEQLRKKGWSDNQIAALVSTATGREMDAASIGEHYVDPDDRQA